jgi:hypothetical protein
MCQQDYEMTCTACGQTYSIFGMHVNCPGSPANKEKEERKHTPMSNDMEDENTEGDDRPKQDLINRVVSLIATNLSKDDLVELDERFDNGEGESFMDLVRDEVMKVAPELFCNGSDDKGCPVGCDHKENPLCSLSCYDD